MLASELIAELQKQIDEHGDLPVFYDLSGMDVTPTFVNTYTIAGKKADDSDNPAVEIYIH